MAELADRAIEMAGRLARWAGADVRFFKEGAWSHVAARAPNGGAHLMDVSVRRNGQGFDGCVVLPDDHTLGGLPHRTGSRGVLEPIEGRIFRDVRDEDGLAAFRACFEGVIAGIPAREGDPADELAGRVVEAAGADSDAVRRILGAALREALDPDDVARVSEAFDAASPAAPSPR